jgi:4-oxalomesaconate hydratase
MAKPESVLCISAHAADFCVRAGGTLARYAEGGAPVRVVVLSPGARGESNEFWKARQGRTTEEEVSEVRRAEARAAARILGVDLVFYDYPDQPLEINREGVMRLVREIRTFRPRVIITHPAIEPYNPDHSRAHEATMEAAYYTGLAGVEPDLPILAPTQIFACEPTQPLTESTGFVPNYFIDITDTMDKKMAATAEFRAQPYHVERYRVRSVQRGTQAAYVAGDPGVRFAEAFQRLTPWAGRVFP